MTQSRASTLIIPVENQARELDAKLLLAAVASGRGFPVILGSRAHVHYHAHQFPTGVYLAKSMRRASDRMFRLQRQLGHEIVGWDEEALVRPPDDEYYDLRLSREAFCRTSHLFAWGPASAEVMRGFPGGANVPVHVTGNPRIDLLRPELRGYFDQQVESIRQRFGRFVLINTNFGQLNHFFPELGEMSAALRDRSLAEADQSAEFKVRRAAHRSRIFDALREAVQPVSRALPSTHFVIRPHPSENHQTWERVAEGLSNVSVCAEGSVVPWLLAASALVHNGCTTAIEAVVTDTPTVAFRPVICAEFDDPLPNGLSIQSLDLDSLIEVLKAVMDGRVPDPPADRAATLAHNLSALDGKLAASRMVDVLTEAGYLDAAPQPSALATRAVAALHCSLRSVVKRINERRAGHRNSSLYHKQRFPLLESQELEKRLERLAEAVGSPGGHEVRRLYPFVFAISPPAQAR